MGIKTKFKGLMYGLKFALNNTQRSLQEKREEQLKILRDIRNKK